MSDPCLTDPVKDEEQTIVKELLDKHSPEQIAAALVRIHHSSKPAAEELLDQGSAASERPQKERREFSNGVWFELSVGRKHTAEPRWLLPMLCRAGHITKNEIGPIKIQEEKTFVELDGGCVDAFLNALGPTRKMEKTVEVTRLDKKPDLGGSSEGRPRRNDRRPRRDEGDASDRKARPKKKFDRDGADKKSFKRDDKRDDKRKDRTARDTKAADKPAKKERVKDQQDDASYAYNKRFGTPEHPSERFNKKKRSDGGSNQDAPKGEKAVKPAPKKRIPKSDAEPSGDKFNRKPKDKKAKPKRTVIFNDGPTTDGFRANKRKKPKPTE